jgi:hypothetical protein
VLRLINTYRVTFATQFSLPILDHFQAGNRHKLDYWWREHSALSRMVTSSNLCWFKHVLLVLVFWQRITFGTWDNVSKLLEIWVENWPFEFSETKIWKSLGRTDGGEGKVCVFSAISLLTKEFMLNQTLTIVSARASTTGCIIMHDQNWLYLQLVSCVELLPITDLEGTSLAIEVWKITHFFPRISVHWFLFVLQSEEHLHPGGIKFWDSCRRRQTNRIERTCTNVRKLIKNPYTKSCSFLPFPTCLARSHILCFFVSEAKRPESSDERVKSLFVSGSRAIHSWFTWQVELHGAICPTCLATICVGAFTPRSPSMQASSTKWSKVPECCDLELRTRSVDVKLIQFDRYYASTYNIIKLLILFFVVNICKPINTVVNICKYYQMILRKTC